MGQSYVKMSNSRKRTFERAMPSAANANAIASANNKLQRLLRPNKEETADITMETWFEILMLNSGLKHIPEHILSHLPLEDLLNCRLVCQAWKDFIDDEKNMWKRELFHKFERILNIFPYCSNLVVDDEDEVFKYEHIKTPCKKWNEKYKMCTFKTKFRAVKLNLIGKFIN